MELNVITSADKLQAIQDDWLDLLQRSPVNMVYLRYEWFLASYEIFHPNDELYILTVTDDRGHLSCIAPLIITSGEYRGTKIRKIGFINNDQSPANDFILSEGSEEICLDIVLDHLAMFSAWEFIDLRKIRVDGITGICMQKMLLEKAHKFGIKENIQSPYIRIDREWDDFWKGRSQRFRKAMRNKINRAMKHPNLVIDKIPVISSKAPELDDMLKISANSWKHEIGNDLLTREDNLRFYKEICSLLGPNGLICIWFLKLGGVPVAFEFHIQYNSVLYPIRADYDKNYYEISPGSILEYEIIKSLFNRNDVSEYNSCGHTYDYLLNWTDTTRRHQNFEIFKNSLKMSILYNFEYKVMVMLRQSKLFRFITKVKARYQ